MTDPVREAFDRVPINRFLGSRLVRRNEEAAVVAFSPRADMLQMVRRGRRIAVTEVDVRQDGRDLLRGLFTYLIYDREPTKT